MDPCDNKEKDRSDKEYLEEIDSTIKKDSVENYSQKDQKAINKRDDDFNDLLEAYIHSYKNNAELKLKLKERFFCLVCGIFIATALLPVAVIVILAFTNAVTYEAVIVSVVAACVELVSAIIVLPKIIAQYLFDKEEEGKVIELVQSMQEYNKEAHKRMMNNKSEG